MQPQPGDRSALRGWAVWLPSVYIATVVLTFVLSKVTPGGAYYRIFGLAPWTVPFFMVIDNDVLVVTILLVLGTPWWYLVCRIGWEGRRRLATRLVLTLGAALSLATCFICTGMTLAAIRQDVQEGHVTAIVAFQYLCVGALCLGALVSASYAVIGALGRRTRRPEI